jgi:hypothetical protein
MALSLIPRLNLSSAGWARAWACSDVTAESGAALRTLARENGRTTALSAYWRRCHHQAEEYHGDRRTPPRAEVGCRTRGSLRRRSLRIAHKIGRTHGEHAGSAGSTWRLPWRAVSAAEAHPDRSPDVRSSDVSVGWCAGTPGAAWCQANRRELRALGWRGAVVLPEWSGLTRWKRQRLSSAYAADDQQPMI